MTKNEMLSSVASTAEILADFRAGKMVILIDDEDRENEGDQQIQRRERLVHAHPGLAKATC